MHLKGFCLSVILVIGFLNKGGECQSLSCPAVRTTSGWLDLFPLPCRKSSECKVMSKQHLCCNGFCTKGTRKSGSIKSTTSQPVQSSVTISDSTSTASTTPSTTTSTTTTTPAPTTTTPAPTTTTTTTTTTPSTTSSTTTTTTTTARPKTTQPPLALQPFLQLLPIQRSARTEAPTTKTSATAAIKTSKSPKLVCPKPGQSPLPLFPIPCEKTSQCRTSSGPDHVCCDNRCIRGVPAPKPTRKPKSHQPLLGVIPRECPSTPLGELLFEVQTCKTDADCWPRVCCPDGTRSYCRTARARLDLVPIANQIDGPVRMFEQYLQCTPPPQYDLFPQKCSSSVDCFPNLCCAEGGKKHCRPPQRSLFALLAGVTQRFGNMRPATANNNL